MKITALKFNDSELHALVGALNTAISEMPTQTVEQRGNRLRVQTLLAEIERQLCIENGEVAAKLLG